MRPERLSRGKLTNVREALEICRTSRTILGANGISLEFSVIRQNNLEAVLTYAGTVVGETVTGLPLTCGPGKLGVAREWQPVALTRHSTSVTDRVSHWRVPGGAVLEDGLDPSCSRPRLGTTFSERTTDFICWAHPQDGAGIAVVVLSPSFGRPGAVLGC